MTPARFLADVDWLALTARALPAPVRPVVAPADPLELSAIEALLLGGAHHMAAPPRATTRSSPPPPRAICSTTTLSRATRRRRAASRCGLSYQSRRRRSPGSSRASESVFIRRLVVPAGRRAREGFSCGCGFCSEIGDGARVPCVYRAIWHARTLDLFFTTTRLKKIKKEHVRVPHRPSLFLLLRSVPPVPALPLPRPGVRRVRAHSHTRELPQSKTTHAHTRRHTTPRAVRSRPLADVRPPARCGARAGGR